MTKVNIKPLADRVIIEPAQAEQKTAGGIIIPDTAKEKPTMGKIVNMSTIENAEIKIGDTVIYKAYSGTEIEFDAKKFLVLPYGDILAKVVETEEI